MRVGAIATRFRVDTVGESDQESQAELREVYVRVCNESMGACSDQAHYDSGRGEIHDGGSDPTDPVEAFAGDVVEVAWDPNSGYPGVPGTREDWFYIEVTAFESDPCRGLIRACGRSGNQASRRGSFRLPAEVAASSGAEPCPVFEPSLGGWAESGSRKGPHLTPLNAAVQVCYPASDE